MGDAAANSKYVAEKVHGLGQDVGVFAPKAPDYAGAANAQTQANRPNQYNPYGSSQWTQDANGNWTQSSQFSGPLGGLNDSLQGQAADSMGQGLDFGSLGQLGGGDAARQQAYDAYMNQANSRLDPQWEQRRSDARTQLLNQGLDPGSEAYKRAEQQLTWAENDARSSAMNSAHLAGEGAGRNVFDQNLMRRQQMMGEMLTGRRAPMQDMMMMQQLLQMAGFMPGGNQLAAAGMQGDYQMGAHGRDMQTMTDIVSAPFDWMKGNVETAASLAPLLSDERLKENVQRFDAEALPGVKFASWTWKGDPSGARYMGVIAQDLESVRPDLVVTTPSGFLAVDYRFLWSDE